MDETSPLRRSESKSKCIRIPNRDLLEWSVSQYAIRHSFPQDSSETFRRSPRERERGKRENECCYAAMTTNHHPRASTMKFSSLLLLKIVIALKIQLIASAGIIVLEPAEGSGTDFESAVRPCSVGSAEDCVFVFYVTDPLPSDISCAPPVDDSKDYNECEGRFAIMLENTFKVTFLAPGEGKELNIMSGKEGFVELEFEAEYECDGDEFAEAFPTGVQTFTGEEQLMIAALGSNPLGVDYETSLVFFETFGNTCFAHAKIHLAGNQTAVAEVSVEVNIDPVSIGMAEGVLETFLYSSKMFSNIRAKSLSVVDAPPPDSSGGSSLDYMLFRTGVAGIGILLCVSI